MHLFRSKSQSEATASSTNQHHLLLGWKSNEEFKRVAEGRNRKTPEFLKYLHLQSLVEQGIAKWEPEDKPRGILMEANEACLLPKNFKQLFNFPADWQGTFKLIAPHPTGSEHFTARLEVQAPDGSRSSSNWTRKGNLLSLGNGTDYSLSFKEINALIAFENWQNIASANRTETDHQILLAGLQKATKATKSEVEVDSCEIELVIPGAKIDIGFPDLIFGETDWEISLKTLPDGGLILVPTPFTEGVTDDVINADDILKRLDHFNHGSEQSTFRIGKQIITLTKAQTKRTRDLLKRGQLNSDQAKQFLKNPNDYLITHVFDPDDIEWSPRVKGIAEWEGALVETSVDGGMGMEVLKVEKANKEQNDELGSPSEATDSDPSVIPLDKYLPYPHLNQETEEFTECLATERTKWGIEHSETIQQKLDNSIFLPNISLKKHQEEGVRWMLAHAHAIDKTATEETTAGNHFAQNRGGVLLADDMGLGKTISVLTFLALRQKEMLAKGHSGAFLVVAPVSLLVNWKDELEKFFSYHSIFTKVVILHRDHDLALYQTGPKSKDLLEESTEGTQVFLKKFGLKRYDSNKTNGLAIDAPGTLVLTNYNTVQRFRFSFCAAKWEVLALDEAQATKNPNIMLTASIKALNARFRILMTGTPVENSLVDFWCLNDTHSPGLLCSLKGFTQNYINRIRQSAPEDQKTRTQVAKEVKSLVGETMLRRLKKDILDKDFPKKIEHRPGNTKILRAPMNGIQLELYENIRKGQKDNQEKVHHLATLNKLKLISIHPSLVDDNQFPVGENKKQAIEILQKSIKGKSLIETILPQVKGANKGEKVLIFISTKNLQWGLARNLEMIYPELGRIPIINGDTKIKSTRINPSRQKLIQDFEDKKGFNICILSPIAAGVGLTITAANHVVHFERVWNPAKEAQATDRAYRIGQNKDVHVWYPIALHPDPEIISFDQALDGLMQRKMSLQDSVLNIEDPTINGHELIGSVIVTKHQPEYWSEERLQDLTPEEFEALIAVLYEKTSKNNTQLTVKTGDKGADIIAWQYGQDGENCLVDAKHTSKKRPLNSSQGVRQVHAASYLYADYFSEEFLITQVVTNARTVSPRVRSEANACGVIIIALDELQKMLLNSSISLEEIQNKLAQKRVSTSR